MPWALDLMQSMPVPVGHLPFCAPTFLVDEGIKGLMEDREKS
jgi:hypothetical protein